MIARTLLIILVALSFGISHAFAEVKPSVEVAEPYLDLRTGPGRGYPITQIVERGEWLEVIVRRTDWIKVRTEQGFIGWIPQQDMAKTLDPDGDYTQVSTVGQGEFAHRRWETGIKIGTFSGARTLGGYLGYYFTENLTLEATLSEAYSSTVDFLFYNLSITHQPWPEWRYSPYFTIGGGEKSTRYSQTELNLSDRIDQTLHAGLGLRIYLTRQMMIRGEYRNTIILTNQDNNDESDEWTIGISAFF